MPEFRLALIFLAGSLVRLLCLKDNPMGLHQDEAYSAYNSWAVMNYGIDSFGYTRPVYYTVWGSGMNVLYSYFTMPFFALFGVSVTTIRLPQAILGCLSILVVYGLGKEMFHSEQAGLFFSFLLAVNPWHIQQSRFGLESNLAVPLLLTAMFFFCRYLNGRKRSLWAASFFWGLTLYSYALTWLLIPLILLASLFFFRKKITFDRTFFLCFLMLFLMALPLFLFLAVNFGLIPEIRTELISIPKLPALRTGEMTFHTWVVKQRILSLVTMLFRQYDDRWWISNATVGSYYYISTPFILLGLFSHIKIFFRWLFRKEELPMHFLAAIWFFAAFLVGCSIDHVYFHKVNYIHIPIILYGGMGILCLGRILRKAKPVLVTAVCLYSACFGYYIYSQASYPVDYSSYGNPWVSHMNWYRYEDALACAQSLTDGKISVFALNYANIMLYDRISPYEFMDTAEYEGDLQFMELTHFGRYYMGMNPPEDAELRKTDTTVYVYPYGLEESFRERGYVTVHADACYGVAYREEIYGINGIIPLEEVSGNNRSRRSDAGHIRPTEPPAATPAVRGAAYF